MLILGIDPGVQPAGRYNYKDTMTNRKLTDHITSEDQASQLEINVLDDPGNGGAHHLYCVNGFDDSTNKSRIQGAYDDHGGAIILFQNGPIPEVGVNGVTNEALMAIVIDRLRSFQDGPFECRENALALTKLEESLMWLRERTRKRIARGVEGTHEK